MTTLKQRQEKLIKESKGFYDFENYLLQRDKNDLFNKVANYIEKLFLSQGCIPPSSYTYLVYNAIYEGKFSLSSFKKNKFSSKEIILM